jgi:hypothetical protein
MHATLSLSLFADDGTQSALTPQSLIGKIRLNAKNGGECWPLYSPYLLFGKQPNGNIEQMILQVNRNGIPGEIKGNETEINGDGNNLTTNMSIKIRLNVHEIFFVKLKALWFVAVLFIIAMFMFLIGGITFCFILLRRRNRILKL